MRNDDKYAIGLDIGAVYRRLGYLLELFDLETPAEIKALQQKLTPSYAILDPVLPQHQLPHFSC